MIGKIIGAFVGDKLAKQSSSMGGASGAALGVVAASVIRRMSLPAMVALGVGGYAAKKFFDKKQAENVAETEAKPPKTSTAPEVKKAPKAA